MQISIEDITDCKRRVTIEIPADEIQQKQEQKLKEIQGARVKGFRPGKAPINIILNQVFGGQRQFRSSVVQGLLEEKFSQAVKQHDLELADSPQLDELNDSGEGAVTFSTICDVFPKVELLDFATLNFVKKELVLNDDEYQKQLDELLKSHGTWQKVDDEQYHAQLGDRVAVNFSVYAENIDPNAVDAGQAVEIVLGQQVRYGFEEGLQGMQVNQTKTLDGLNNYKFNVSVTSISTLVKAEVNDELAHKLGVHCAHDIPEYLHNGVKSYVEDLELKRIRAEFLDKLVEVYKDLPLPEKLLERYQTALNQGEFNAANLGPAGIAPEEQVRRAVILDLLRSKIAKKFDIVIDNDRVIELITRLALSTFGNYDLVLDLYSKNPVLLNQVRTLVLDEQITKLVLEHAKVSVESASLAKIEQLDEKSR